MTQILSSHGKDWPQVGYTRPHGQRQTITVHVDKPNRFWELFHRLEIKVSTSLHLSRAGSAGTRGSLGMAGRTSAPNLLTAAIDRKVIRLELSSRPTERQKYNYRRVRCLLCHTCTHLHSAPYNNCTGRPISSFWLTLIWAFQHVSYVASQCCHIHSCLRRTGQTQLPNQRQQNVFTDMMSHPVQFSPTVLHHCLFLEQGNQCDLLLSE